MEGSLIIIYMSVLQTKLLSVVQCRVKNNVGERIKEWLEYFGKILEVEASANHGAFTTPAPPFSTQLYKDSEY
jgi:hypothetical protein